MKVALPTRVSMRYVAYFAAFLLLVEVVEGTPVFLALTAQAFMLVSALAFNVAGGLAYPSGACIFFNAVLSLSLGVLLKAVLGEPLQSNLQGAQQTMLTYLAGMVSILIAAILAAKLRRKRGLLERIDTGMQMDQVGLGCLLIAYVTPYLLPSAFQGTFSQFNNAFVYLAIVLPVYYRARQTDGRSSFHYVALIAWMYLTYTYGISAFSKQGLFGPSVAWMLAALAAGYRVSGAKLLAIASTVLVATTVLTPYSQLARNYRGEANQSDLAFNLLLHPIETRALYNEQLKLNYMLGAGYHWFDQPQGLLDRLTMVPVDDALVYSTDHLRPGSPYALWSYVLNMVPRYLYPGKPTLLWGNVYAHDIGLIGEGDETTGISFTPYADGYHTAGWVGVTLILGAMFFVMFYVCDSVAGSVASSPWSLVYILYFTHAASEGMLGMTMYAVSTTTPALISAALISTYVAPILGNLVTPRRKVFHQL
ncbi:MAG: hypothetical protein ACRYGF_05735 [Janthinobacterium lividum]